jgi:tetratricopeptide (TPR) repeat protein
VELLERDEALGALAEAHAAAGKGDGRIIVVTGEAGIGKTSLVTRFLRDHGAGSRVLVGSCDDLSIPRPLAPLYDFAGTVSARLEAALFGGAEPYEIHRLLIAGLRESSPPAVLVLEDIHWADDATLDVVTVLARRIGSLPVLLVLTCRDGEARPDHPVHAAVSTTRPDVFLALAPLSPGAVASLAGDGADAVYAATGGNPFYVTELLAARTSAEIPPSVANAVVGRASRLDDASRRLVELVSVVPNRVGTSVLDVVMPGWVAAAEEPERRQLLEVQASSVRFRHELARNALRSSLPIATRRRLHREILDALLAADADPADIVHHAEAAGAEDVVADYALVAARRAAALDSNKVAYSHYRRASQFLDRLAPPEQAAVLEELATAAYVVGRLEDAFSAIGRAAAIYGELGDEEGVGRCTRVLSRFHWYAGDGIPARERAAEAIAILEPLGESVELARAYSGLSQLAMLAEQAEEAIVLGERALELAVRLGDESTRAHALVNIGSARIMLDPADRATLLEAHAVADAVGDRQEAMRALGNLGFSLMWSVEPEPALRYERQALAYAHRHEVHNLGSYVATMVAWLELRAGEWDEAERVIRDKLERDTSVVQLLDKTVLTELAVRRGDPDAVERLADVEAQAERTGEPQRIAPVLELTAEWALTSEKPLPVARLERFVAEVRPPGRFATRVAAWAVVAGVDLDVDASGPAAHAAMLRRDWLGAAAAFGEVGWTYDRALMLSLLDDEESLTEALALARELGAVDEARGRASARARAARAGRPAGGDAGQSRRPHRPPARGAGARGGGVHERGDRRAPRGVPANRGAPCRGRAQEAGCHDAPGGRAASLRAPAGRSLLSLEGRRRGAAPLALRGLALDGYRLGVGRRDRNRAAAEPVEPVRERDEIALERVPGLALERREGLLRRPVPRAEEVDELLRRAEPEREGPLRHLERPDCSSEELAQMGLGSPEHRRLQPCRRGHVRADRLEEPADEAVGRPARQGDRAAGPADPEQLGGRARVVGGEHRAEDRRDRVEGRVREGQRLGVALHELHGEALGGRALAAPLEQGRHVVDADRLAAVPGGRDGRVAAAGGDVEHAPAGPQVGRVAEVLGDEHDPRGHDREVAARPGRLLLLLDGAEVGGGGFQDGCHQVSPSCRSNRVVRVARRYGQASGPASAAATHLRPRAYLSGCGCACALSRGRPRRSRGSRARGRCARPAPG